MKVKITSDGFYSRVLLNGEHDISECCRAASINIEADTMSTARIELVMPESEIIAEADLLVTVLPDGKRYRLVPLFNENVAFDENVRTIGQ